LRTPQAGGRARRPLLANASPLHHPRSGQQVHPWLRRDLSNRGTTDHPDAVSRAEGERRRGAIRPHRPCRVPRLAPDLGQAPTGTYAPHFHRPPQHPPPASRARPHTSAEGSSAARPRLQRRREACAKTRSARRADPRIPPGRVTDRVFAPHRRRVWDALIRSSCKSPRFGTRLSLCTPRVVGSHSALLELDAPRVEAIVGDGGGPAVASASWRTTGATLELAPPPSVLRQAMLVLRPWRLAPPPRGEERPVWQTIGLLYTAIGVLIAVEIGLAFLVAYLVAGRAV
jgi:hypothetical protein